MRSCTRASIHVFFSFRNVRHVYNTFVYSRSILDQFSRMSCRSLCVSMRRSRVDKQIKQLKSPPKSKQNEQIKIKNETVSTPSVAHLSLTQYKRVNKKETSKKVKTKNSKKISEGKTKSIVQKRVFLRVHGIVKKFQKFLDRSRILLGRCPVL